MKYATGVTFLNLAMWIFPPIGVANPLTQSSFNAKFEQNRDLSPKRSSHLKEEQKFRVGCPKNMQYFYNKATFEESLSHDVAFREKYGTNQAHEICREYKHYFSTANLPEQKTKLVENFRKLKQAIRRTKDIEKLISDFNSKNIGEENVSFKIPYTPGQTKKREIEAKVDGDIQRLVAELEEFKQHECPTESNNDCLMTIYGRFKSLLPYYECRGHEFLALNASNWTLALNKVYSHCLITGQLPNLCENAAFFLNDGRQMSDLSPFTFGPDGQLYRESGEKTIHLSQEELIKTYPGAISVLEACSILEYCDFIPNPKSVDGTPFLVDCKNPRKSPSKK